MTDVLQIVEVDRGGPVGRQWYAERRAMRPARQPDGSDAVARLAAAADLIAPAIGDVVRTISPAPVAWQQGRRYTARITPARLRTEAAICYHVRVPVPGLPDGDHLVAVPRVAGGTVDERNASAALDAVRAVAEAWGLTEAEAALEAAAQVPPPAAVSTAPDTINLVEDASATWRAKRENSDASRVADGSDATSRLAAAARLSGIASAEAVASFVESIAAAPVAWDPARLYVADLAPRACAQQNAQAWDVDAGFDATAGGGRVTRVRAARYVCVPIGGSTRAERDASALLDALRIAALSWGQDAIAAAIAPRVTDPAGL